MIGLSVSFCVRDLAAGKVAMEDVQKIVAGTRIPSWRKMKSLIQRYLEVYWRDNPAECERIVRQLVANTKRATRGQNPGGPVIEQPRLRKGGRAPLLAGPNGLTHWVNSESEIQWCN